jgi:hypothetical protein
MEVIDKVYKRILGEYWWRDDIYYIKSACLYINAVFIYSFKDE